MVFGKQVASCSWFEVGALFSLHDWTFKIAGIDTLVH